MRRSCQASVVVDASAEAVWAVISDVTRVGEWSGECRGCTWLDGQRAAVSGARFRGRNRRYGFGWARINEVLVADRPRVLVWRTIPNGPYRDSVEWRIELDGRDGTARVTESFEILHIPRVMELMVAVAMPAHRDRTGDLRADLVRLKDVVESTKV